MKNLPAKTPVSALRDLRDAYVPIDAPRGSYLELSIRIADEDLTIRDLSAFLDFIDRIYGRLSEKGLPSYARKEYGHLKIKKLQKGSWELLLQEVLSSGYSYSLIVILLAVKYLPPAVQSIATAYNQVEQGRLAHANRKRIKAEMEKDEHLAELSNERRNQITQLVDFLHEKEKERLHRAIRFTQKRLLSIKIRVKRNDEK
tara:strand:- start:4001 stop:4603 length:603 start_codon:yes stop_codon:yes gene_type:complete